MSRTISILRLAPLALALACEAAGGADTSDPPVDETDDGEPASTSEPTGGDPTGPAADFGPGPVFACDPWLQDCPEGQKCNLYSTAGDQTLDGARCVPLDDSPAQIAELCIAHGLIAICDEVWEHLVFDGAAHLPLIGLPATLISCLGKLRPTRVPVPPASTTATLRNSVTGRLYWPGGPSPAAARRAR